MTSRAVDLVSPRFIKARNEKALQKEMAELILRSGKQYDYYQIQQLKDGSFIAWYRDSLNFTYTKHLNARKDKK